MKLLVLFFVFLGPALAIPEQDLQKGDQLAQELLSQIGSPTESTHPFYQGIPSSPDLSTPMIHSSPAAQLVMESSASRPQFKLDPLKDPLLEVAEKLTENALSVIGGDGAQVVTTNQTGTDETLACEESGEEEELTCKNTLTVPVRKTRIQREWQGSFHIGKCSGKERHGHYLPCQQLINTFHSALHSGVRRRSPADTKALFTMTGAYKACMNELKGRSISCGGGCIASLPSLPFSLDAIKEVVLIPSPQNPNRPHLTMQHYHRYNSGRIEWWYLPLIKVTYEEEKIEILTDEWNSTCGGLEERADQGACAYGTKVCSQGPQTRMVEGIPITRDCWEETFIYHCSHPSQNNCGPLRARGCVQVKSDCKQRIGNTCVVYTQTYQCNGDSQTITKITGGKPPFCLDGNCRAMPLEANDELMSSMAQLSLLKEMQGQFNGSVFKGNDNRCSKATLSFKDCCGSGKGWGVSLGVAGCSGDEQALALKRQKGLCHFIGTYCSQRETLTKICLQKKSTYCCFGSKLLRAFHEQGRPQIGMGWGSPEAPLCRGFTVEELQRIDFSKLDLKEAFETYQPGKLQNVNKKLKERLESIKQGVSSKKQREDA
jgi:type-F conjugative transfer system mating-pair stabilization protein TraN